MGEDNAVQKKTSGMAITSLVLGVLAITTSFLPIINNGSFFLGILGAIFAIVGIMGIRKGKSGGKGIAIAGLVTSVLALVIVLATQAMYGAAINNASKSLDKMTGEATQEILGKDVEVTFGDYSISKGSYGLIESELPVTVKNLLKEGKSFSIQIEAVDPAGNRIVNDYIYANDLGANQSQKFKAFQYVPSDNYDAMQQASFNVVSVSEL